MQASEAHRSNTTTSADPRLKTYSGIDKSLNLTFFLICDEWLPQRGGISRFNRLLAIALTSCGHRVFCIVESASKQEIQDAATHQISLVSVSSNSDARHLPTEVVPDAIVGHDRAGEPLAIKYASQYPRSPFVYILHANPYETERYKAGSTAFSRSSAQAKQTRDAVTKVAVVAAVGPRLTRYAGELFDTSPIKPDILQLTPGLIPRVSNSTTRPASDGLARGKILILGRTSYIQLKGLDVAAHALAKLSTQQDTFKCDLVIRGAPNNRCEPLKSELAKLSRLDIQHIEVRPFTDSFEEVAQDLEEASLCLMPSRAEGFGLAAVEAISFDTPVLISKQSGLAELLSQTLDTKADRMILDVTDNQELNTRIWSTGIQRALADLSESREYAKSIREALANTLDWAKTAQVLTSRVLQERSRITLPTDEH